jgi:hypothetical protein
MGTEGYKGMKKTAAVLWDHAQKPAVELVGSE